MVMAQDSWQQGFEFKQFRGHLIVYWRPRQSSRILLGRGDGLETAY
jgi:hypothetical protein